MSTLHKMFNRGFLKKSILVWSSLVILSFLLHYLTDNNLQDNTIWITLILILISISVGILPLFPIIGHNHFFQSLHSLINQGFSRKELMKFAFKTLCLKSILVSLNYITVIFIMTYFTKDKKHIDNFDLEYITYDNILALLLLFIMMMFILIAALFSKSLRRDYQRALKTKSAKFNLKKVAGLTLIFMLGALILLSYDIPIVVYPIAMSIAAIMASLSIFNSSFNIMNKEKFTRKLYLFSPLYAFPFLVLLLLINLQVHDKTIPAKQRIDSVLTLGKLKTDYSQDEKLEFLSVSEKEQYHELLGILAHEISLEQLFVTSNKPGKVIELSSFLRKKTLSDQEIISFINFADKYKEIEKLTFEFDSKLFSFFKKHKLEPQQIQPLIASKSSLKQLAGIIMSRKNMNKKEFQDMVKNLEKQLNENVVNHGFVKRELASKKEKI